MDCPLCEVEHPRGSDRCPARQVGRVVDGRYRIEGLIGCGGMGAVYEAVQLGLGRRVALKTMLARGVRDAESLVRFRREATAIASIRHPGIVQVQDLGNDADGAPFMVMERLEGASVAELLDAGPLPIARVVWIAREALDALAAAHEHGLVHRDVKPSNLFVARDGRGGELVKLLDFGLTKVLAEASELTRTGFSMGSAPYMSPEQAEDAKRVDARTDVYGMGAALFEMLTGYLPVSGGSEVQVLLRVAAGEITRHPRWIRRDVPDALDAIVARALARAPQERFSTAREMSAALAVAPTAPSAEDLATAAALATAPTLAGAPVPRRSSARRPASATIPAPPTALPTAAPIAPPTAAPAVPPLAAPIAPPTAVPPALPEAPRSRRVLGLGLAGVLAVSTVVAVVLAVPDAPPAVPALPLLPPSPSPSASAPAVVSPTPPPGPPGPAPSVPAPLEPVTPVETAPPSMPGGPRDPGVSDSPSPADRGPRPQKVLAEDSEAADEAHEDDDPPEPVPAGPVPRQARAQQAGEGAPRDDSFEVLPDFNAAVSEGRPSDALIRLALSRIQPQVSACDRGAFTAFGIVNGSSGRLITGQVPENDPCLLAALRSARYPRSTQPMYNFTHIFSP